MRSRRDLRRINRWMLQSKIMATLLLRHFDRPPKTILDLGSGDGALMLGVARRLAPKWPGVTARLLDQQDILSDETRRAFEAIGWRVERIVADVFDYLSHDAAKTDIISANLFLHHFENPDLARLLELAAARTTLFAACEPRRDRFSLLASSLVWVIGCNDVTQWDAKTSVRAGFNGRDLSKLWPSPNGWVLDETYEMPFTHCFAARRSTLARENAPRADVR
ncbi:MAG: class I SAM-dependent methyltransferase [Methylocystis sp.]|uniref:class I SAM-dependent methyltransferase n=1 Tax=Methylocystis sp. TaxID=1911079 RepID=UPI003D0FEAF0